jgi:limonene-1,2-epoxide hydrolase
MWRQVKDGADFLETERVNLETAQKFLAALRVRDWTLMKSSFEESSVWTLPGTSIISGKACGVDAIINRWRIIVRYGINFELKHLLCGRDGAALSLHNTAKRENWSSTNLWSRFWIPRAVKLWP